MVKDEKEPTLLIYDGHSTHVQLAVVKMAKQNNITIIKLPPHTSHLLQPLDLCVFKPYKDAWDQEMVKWQRTHKGEKLPKDQFSAIVGRVWKNLNSNVIKKGFEKSGIYPFNRKAVTEYKLDPEALKRWKKHHETLSKKQTLARSSPLTLTKLCLNKINSCIKLNSNPVTILPKIVSSKSSEKISFEDLLIQSTKQSQTANVKKKIVKISASAEVITHQDVIERLKQKEDDKAKKEQEKDEKRKQREQRDQKKKIIISKQNEKIDKVKVKKIDEKSKNIRLTKNKQSHVTDPPSSEVTLSEIISPNSDLNVRDPIHFLQDDSSILNCHASTSKLPPPLTSKTKIAILEDRYLKVDEKLTKDIFTGHKMKRPADFTLQGTDEIHTSKQIKYEKQNNPIKIKTKKKQNKIKIEEDLEEDSDFTIHDSDGSDMDLESYCNIYLTEYKSDDEENVYTDFGLTDIEYYENTSNKLKKGDWVLVKFLSKKSVKHYVGQIININDDIPVIKYVRKTQTKQRGLLFVYPNVDDICELKHVADIVSVLPKPTITRRGQISFSINIGKFNLHQTCRHFYLNTAVFTFYKKKEH
ncbi:unnamed protein product [Parnassius mnemosyne]|uniref:DDE-1 domain-containing protein n=1 Tax=Parnassius mnemosyne TaxID=213953 RepID=A0AAV1L0A0_9NEOP